MSDDLIRRMDAMQACQVGPSDEWSRDTKSGYNQAATDCAMNILRVPAVQPADRIEQLELELSIFRMAQVIMDNTVAALTAALVEWDALIDYQYSGSREAMSAMADAAQRTAKLLKEPSHD